MPTAEAPSRKVVQFAPPPPPPPLSRTQGPEQTRIINPTLGGKKFRLFRAIQYLWEEGCWHLENGGRQDY